MKKNVVIMACCCVTETVEMNRPIQRVLSRKKQVPAKGGIDKIDGSLVLIEKGRINPINEKFLRADRLNNSSFRNKT
ncbi:MAG: hypothetical protein JSW15_02065 [Deltaproteobacteria bacterium]|nr:MAG: hypothetical protein JSW15_02065 [Deltaproteobacteria bacterium]